MHHTLHVFLSLYYNAVKIMALNWSGLSFHAFQGGNGLTCPPLTYSYMGIMGIVSRPLVHKVY